MSAIGHFYEENGVMHLTAKLTDFFPAHTRCFARPAEMYEELMGLRSVPYDRALELCDESETVSLPGDLREWSKIVLCGPSELRYQVRFTVFAEPQGPILQDYHLHARFGYNPGMQWSRLHRTIKAKLGWVFAVYGCLRSLADTWGRGQVVKEWASHLPRFLQLLSEPWVTPIVIIVGIGLIFGALLERDSSATFNIRWLPTKYQEARIPHVYFVGIAVIVAVLLVGFRAHGRREIIIPLPSEQHTTVDQVRAEKSQPPHL
jgi:hypothetical protein